MLQPEKLRSLDKRLCGYDCVFGLRLFFTLPVEKVNEQNNNTYIYIVTAMLIYSGISEGPS